MRSGLSTALDDALAHRDAGESVSAAWLRHRHPEHAEAVADALSVQDALGARSGRPRLAGAYRIVEPLGSGAMGAVYFARAIDPSVRPASAAIKVMRPAIAVDPRAVARFRREIRAGLRVRHPNVVWTLGGGVDRRRAPPLWHIVLELVEGESLRAVLRRDGPLPVETARSVLLHAARGLSAIHDAGLVHRDVKPENLILARDGTVKVADLGVVAMTNGRVADGGDAAFAGSPRYAPPEQFVTADHALDGRTDLFALGLTMFELLTGAHPSDTGPAGRSVRPSVVRPEVPEDLDEIVAALTEPDRRHRPRSAADVVRALEPGDAAPWLARRRAIRCVPEESPLRRTLSVDAAFVGRESVLDRLSQAWRDVASGDGACVFVTGGAGTGKSRLAAEFCARLFAADPSVRVLHGGFEPTSGDRTYGAFRDALRVQAGRDGLEGVCRHWLTSTPLLAEPFRRFLVDAPASGDERLLTRDALPRAFADALSAVARAAPAVLVVEDLHFAEKEAHGVLRAVALATRGLPLLIVATARNDAARPPGAVPVPLGRISPAGTLELICASLGPGSAAERLASRLVEDTDGSPQHMLLAIRHLGAEGRIRRRANGSWELRRPDDALPVPADVGESARRALARMERSDLDLIRAAAVAGFAFDPALVAAATGRDPDSALAALKRIEREHSLVRMTPDGARFEHHRFQELVYSDTPRQLRRSLHSRTAAATEQRLRTGAAPAADDRRVVELCRHHLRGAVPVDAEPYVMPALDLLRASARHLEGLELARLAMRRIRPIDPKLRIRLLLWISFVLDNQESVRSAEIAIEESRALGDEALRATALIHVGTAICSLGDVEKSIPPLMEAADAARNCGDAATSKRALLTLAKSLATIGRSEQAVEFARRAAAVDAGDAGLQCETLRLLSDVLRMFGDLGEALTAALAALDAARCSGSAAQVGIAQTGIGSALCRMGRMDEGAVHLREAAELLRASGNVGREAYTTGALSSTYVCLGRWTEARDTALRSVELVRLTRASPLVTSYACLANVLVKTGELDRALAAGDAGVAVCRAKNHRMGKPLVHQMRGNALVALGEHARAVRDFETAEAALAAMGRSAEAAEMGADIAASLAERGQLGAAEARFRESLAGQIAAGGDPGAPYTRLRLAAALVALGKRDAAATELELARAALAGSIDAEETFRCAVVGALVAGPADGAAIDAVRRGAGSAAARLRLEAELTLWELTREPEHARGAAATMLGLLRHSSPKFRRSMLAGSAIYRSAVAAGRAVGVDVAAH